MSLSVERWYPACLALLLCVAAWKFDVPFPVDQKEFLAAALSLGAVLTGFIATAQAILMALPSESVMGRMRSTGYVNDLIRYISEALYIGVIYCGLNLSGFYLITKPGYFECFAPIWIGFTAYAGLTFVRVTRFMMKIMRLP
jgi:hypothetical protein